MAFFQTSFSSTIAVRIYLTLSYFNNVLGKDGKIKVKIESEVKEQEFLRKLQKRFDHQIQRLRNKNFLHLNLEDTFPIMMYKRSEAP